MLRLIRNYQVNKFWSCHDLNICVLWWWCCTWWDVAMVGVYLVLVFSLLGPALWPGLSSDNCWLSQEPGQTRRLLLCGLSNRTGQQSHTGTLDTDTRHIESIIILLIIIIHWFFPGQGRGKREEGVQTFPEINWYCNPMNCVPCSLS